MGFLPGLTDGMVATLRVAMLDEAASITPLVGWRIPRTSASGSMRSSGRWHVQACPDRDDKFTDPTVILTHPARVRLAGNGALVIFGGNFLPSARPLARMSVRPGFQCR